MSTVIFLQRCRTGIVSGLIVFAWCSTVAWGQPPGEPNDRGDELAERLRYSIQTMRAQREWDERAFGSARKTLAGTKPELRGWEYNFLFAKFNENQATFQHAGPVGRVAYMPDGSRIVSADWSGKVTVRDARTGRELSSFDKHSSMVVDLAVSLDGQSIVSADGKSIKLWDTRSGEDRIAITGRRMGILMAVALSPNGERIASGATSTGMGGLGPGEVKLWDAATGRELRSFVGHKARVATVAFSHDGKRLFSGSHDGTIKLWDVESGEEIRTFAGHKFIVGRIALSPDGRKLVSSSRDKSARVWDVETGEELLSFTGHESAVNCAVFSPTGDHIASGGMDRTIRLWNVADGRELATFSGHDQSILDIAFSPDGKQLASGDYDKSIKIWQTSHEPGTLRLAGHSSRVDSVAVTPDGKQIVSGGGDYTDYGEAGDVTVWNASTGHAVREYKNYGRVVALSPDGKHVVSGSYAGALKLWDLSTVKSVVSLGRHKGLHAAAFSSDGRRIATGSFERSVKIWNAETGREERTLTHTQAVHCVAFSPDGRKVIAGGGEPLFNKAAGTVFVWDAITGEELRQLEGHGNTVLCAVFSPGGQQIASGGHDHLVKLWDAASGKLIMTLDGHTSSVAHAQFSSDGRRLASGGYDAVRLWDPVSGSELLTLRKAYGPLAFTRNGQRLITTGGRGTLVVWNAPESRE